MIMSEGPGVAILKFLTFAKKGILYLLVIDYFSDRKNRRKTMASQDKNHIQY